MGGSSGGSSYPAHEPLLPVDPPKAKGAAKALQHAASGVTAK
jgi:hypothetical protein